MKPVLALAFLLLSLPAAARSADPIDGSFKKADAMIEKGDYAKARDALDGILAELKPGDKRLVLYYERTGAAWLREGKTGEAHGAFTAALKAVLRFGVTDKSAAKAYTGMGLCLRRENRDAYALRFFQKALTFNPDEGTKMFVEDQIREIEGAPPLPAR